MEALGASDKRRHRFPWYRRKSQKAPNDATFDWSRLNTTQDEDEGDSIRHAQPIITDGAKVSSASLVEEPKSSTSTPEKGHVRFEERRIVAAVDRSGSTYGGTLKRELAFVHSICSILSPRNEHPVQILPWNDSAGRIIPMRKTTPKPSKIDSDGGTDPRVLYTSVQYLQALQACGAWLLLTDGRIDDSVVQDFAWKTAQCGMHGTACIVVVFGSARDSRPAESKISVGVALYAVTPNCLFTFYDEESDTLYNLQSKGCFKGLLSDPEAQPLINFHTRWSDLPKISIGALRNIQIPDPMKLTKEEIALQGQRSVNMDRLYANELSQDELGAIVRNDDDLKSLIVAEMTRGRGEELDGWLQNLYKESPTLSKERPDIAGKAQTAMNKVLRYLGRDNRSTPLANAQAELRKAHLANWKKFQSILSYYYEERHEVEEYNDRIHWASSLSADMQESSRSHDNESFSPRHISSTSTSGYECYEDIDPAVTYPTRYNKSNDRVTNMFGMSKTKATNEGQRGRASSTKPPDTAPENQTSTDINCAPAIAERKTDELFFPGFTKSSNASNPGLIGTCMACKGRSILCLLFKTPPKLSTPQFPVVGSQSALAFPLAMADFAELDIISSFVCCESCALYLVRNTARICGETIVDALPVVSIVENEVAWLGVVNAALRGRFRMEDLPTLFVAMLDRMTLTSLSRTDDTADAKLLQEALGWARNNIVESTQVPRNLSASFTPSLASSSTPTLTNFASLLSERDMFHPEKATNRELFSLRYPLPGFAVIVRLLADRGIPQVEREFLTFHRFIYHLTETFFHDSETTSLQDARQRLANLLGRVDVTRTILYHGNPPDGPVANITSNDLLMHSSALIDQTSLDVFQGLTEFTVVNDRSGPATAVFLHFLYRLATDYASPIDAFNTIKTLASMTTVIHDPFNVSDERAKEIILTSMAA